MTGESRTGIQVSRTFDACILPVPFGTVNMHVLSSRMLLYGTEICGHKSWAAKLRQDFVEFLLLQSALVHALPETVRPDFSFI